MRKYTSRFLAITMAGMMALSMTACGTSTSSKKTEKATTEASTIANPVTECSEEEMVEKTGIDLPTPDGATDVTYSYIETDEELISQMDFTLDGNEMFLRACNTSLLNLNDLEDEDAKASEIEDFDFSKGDISGLYYEWTQSGTAVIQERDALYNVNDKEKVGYIAWVDVVPGILYNLGMKDNATYKKLSKYAEQVFVPVQGEAYGDDELIEQEFEESNPEYLKAFNQLLDDIYETKAGSAGSSSRVEAAAKETEKLVSKYADKDNCLADDSVQGLAGYKYSQMMEEDEDFIANYTEELDAMADAVSSKEAKSFIKLLKSELESMS